MATLPPELWMMIFDIVIEEGIIRLDHCDHNTFPYDHVFLSPGQDHHRFYGSYHRLRLVCRSFNALLGTRLYYDLHTSSFSFPASTKALRIPAYGRPHEPTFQQLLVDASRREQLVCLEVSCYISTSSNLPNLSTLFRAADERALPNIQRLALSLLENNFLHAEFSFWTRLHRAFPNLVTLSIRVDDGYIVLTDNTEVTFETLEILRLAGDIGYSDCRFPRLRHISFDDCSNHELETLEHSLQLESLLVRSFGLGVKINLRSFSQLLVLSISEDQLRKVVPLYPDHPLEHLWLYFVNTSVVPRAIEEISKRLPGISRITMDISSPDRNRRIQLAKELRRMNLDSFGLAARPIQYGDSLLVIERVADVIGGGIVNDGVWGMVRGMLWW
jgi:hypothetical protein